MLGSFHGSEYIVSLILPNAAPATISSSTGPSGWATGFGGSLLPAERPQRPKKDDPLVGVIGAIVSDVELIVCNEDVEGSRDGKGVAAGVT